MLETKKIDTVGLVCFEITLNMDWCNIKVMDSAPNTWSSSSKIEGIRVSIPLKSTFVNNQVIEGKQFHIQECPSW